MRYQGEITNWKDDEGFGFITPKGGGKDIFVHIKSFGNRQRRPVRNEIVTYELKTDDKGRTQAVSVAFDGEGVPSTSSVRRNVSFLLTIAFLFFIAGSVFAGKLPVAVLWFYFVASTVAFVAYALDKSAAKNNQWRTQRKHFTLYRIDRWLAGGFSRPKPSLSQVQQTIFSSRILGHRCIQLRRSMLVILTVGCRGASFHS